MAWRAQVGRTEFSSSLRAKRSNPETQRTGLLRRGRATGRANRSHPKAVRRRTAKLKLKARCLVRRDPVVFRENGTQVCFVAATRDRPSRIVPWDVDPRQFFLTAVPNEIKLLLANLQQMEMQNISQQLINAAFQGRPSRALEDDSFGV